MSLTNVGELFKFLNSEICSNFFQNVTHDNKNEIIDKMMNDNTFIETARLYVSDDNIIRSKIETMLGQLMKKTQCVKKKRRKWYTYRQWNLFKKRVSPHQNDDP